MLPPFVRMPKKIINAVRNGAQATRERVVVLRGSFGVASLKWPLVILLATFLAGGIVGYRYGTATFRQFKADAAKMQAQKIAENKRLAADLEWLRRQLSAADETQSRSDAKFSETLGPASDKCVMESKPLNEVINRANL